LLYSWILSTEEERPLSFPEYRPKWEEVSLGFWLGVTENQELAEELLKDLKRGITTFQ